MDHHERDLLSTFWRVRSHTEALARGLSPEDQTIQSMPDASPTKWHRAHTTWFFEQFILLPHAPGYQAFDQDFSFLFNSYYEAVGARQPRFARGLITRPDANAVTAYREHVDEAMAQIMSRPDLGALVELGLHHEQQHQELLITDALHALSCNPLTCAFLPHWHEREIDAAAGFAEIPSQIITIGADGGRFSFDNEHGQHKVLLQDHAIARSLVTNRNWREFMADGGYSTSSLWMADGWAAVQDQLWTSPMHWRCHGGDDWAQFSPAGEVPLLDAAPVRHVSWYEADAYARWKGCRLPTEFEWEHAAGHALIDDTQGHVWQWTSSAYTPYPGFRTADGAIGEYNGKFMVNQMVLRGGSSATSPGHTRLTYRNFFQPDRRWQFTGLRLARDL